MPGTLVEKATCETCGMEVRDGSAFCFNCGESVVIEPPPPPIIKPANGSLNGSDPMGAVTLAFGEVEPAPILMPEGKPAFISEEPPPAEISIAEPTASSTAFPAQRPRRTRLVKKAPVEVEWVESSRSGIGYVAGVLVFALAAVALLVLAMYLR